MVKKQPADKNISWSIQGVRVLGTDEQIKLFCQLNKDANKELLYQPFEDIGFLALEASRLTQGCTDMETRCSFESTDVEKLGDQEMALIDQFNWGGLFLKARVKKVIDGDTLAVVVFVRMHDLCFGRKTPTKTGVQLKMNGLPSVEPGLGKEPREFKKGFKSLPSSKKDDEGFFACLHLRTYGYDAVEKDQPAGKEARMLLEKKIESLKGIIWCQLIDPSVAKDKYDRNLAVIYEDQGQSRLLNDYLYRLQKKNGKVYVQSYLGGKKRAF